MNKIEILSPAGGFDSVVAAVRSGADAVYIGATQFSARASAHNFDETKMRECTRYCHERGVDVHLALNTLIFDDEMESALNLAETAAKADIDAIIVQDIGLATLIQKAIPDLPLHASTQMSVHTPYGAKALYETGFRRVVLSRELSLGEIREIRDFCPDVELEVFVHGALCMCVSGQCYFSAMLGGRSANRGMCAQPCRLPMQFGDSDHALSLKDNGSLHYLRELEAIGVASAKIEGRMKRPEYVAAATAAAREARDKGTIDPKTLQRLQAVFSRTGFTDGFLSGKRGGEMFGYRRKDDVVSADQKLLKEIRAEYKDEAHRVGIDMALCVKTGEKITLAVTDGERKVAVESAEFAETAMTAPLTEEKAKHSLQKTGGTPYYIKSITVSTDGVAVASAAALNALRRNALEKLSEQRSRRHDYHIEDFSIRDMLQDGAAAHENWVCSQNLQIPASQKRNGIVFVSTEGLIDPETLRVEEGLESLLRKGARVGVEAPRVCFGQEKQLYAALRELRSRGVSDLLAHNIGAAYIGKELGYTVHAGFGLNLGNSYSLKWAADYGFADAEASVELEIRQIENLKKAIPVGVIRYGYFPLMICRNAPAGAQESCKTETFLQDRKKEKFPVRVRNGYCEIYNCVPILMPQKDYAKKDGVFHILRFHVENSVDNKEKILAEMQENRGFERITHGLYQRGVKNFTIF